MTNPDTVPVTVKLPRPPEGMEWYHHPQVNSGYELRDASGKVFAYRAEWNLRPIVSATVMVEMPVEVAERVAVDWPDNPFCVPDAKQIGVAARAALARKPDVCGKWFHSPRFVDTESNTNSCDGHCEGATRCTLPKDHKELQHAAPKPCPVMVCNPSGEFFDVCLWWDGQDQHRNRRPCKHYEGHGGEHE